MRSPQEVERGLAAPENLGLESRIEIRQRAVQLLEEMPEGSGRLVIDQLRFLLVLTKLDELFTIEVGQD